MRALPGRSQPITQAALPPQPQVAGLQQLVVGLAFFDPGAAAPQHVAKLVEAFGFAVDECTEVRPAADEALVRDLQCRARRVFVVPEQVVHRAEETLVQQPAQVLSRLARPHQRRHGVYAGALLRIHARVRVLEGEAGEQAVELGAFGIAMPPVQRLGPVLDARAQRVELIIQRLLVACRGVATQHGAHEVDLGDVAGHRHVDLFALQRRLPQPRQQVLQQRQVIGVVLDPAHVAQQPRQHLGFEVHFGRQLLGQLGRQAARLQAQEALRRADDGLAQFVVVEPPHQVGRLVDGVGQLQVGGAVVQVLAAHRQHDVAARMGREEVVQHALEQLPGVVNQRVGGVEDRAPRRRGSGCSCPNPSRPARR
ncbi:MAG: hypothetical protein C0505_18740 [Leptothrix sp. (in: Bacteria)]|nr:hypothetical protein [Leptothrix sp. (in: b-proteobacteria)]